jgi:hypothetical protein
MKFARFQPAKAGGGVKPGMKALAGTPGKLN